jgi:hypothetical protein
MIQRRTCPRFAIAILAVASVLAFAPKLRSPHLTTKLRALEQISLSGMHRFIDDAVLAEEATSSDACVVSNLEPILPLLTGGGVRWASPSGIIIPLAPKFTSPLRRRPASADREDSLV